MKKELHLLTRWRKAQRVLLLLLCTAFTLPSKAETLTVYDGTKTNDHVPAYIYYWDDFTRSEFVIPAADLADMAGGTISAITFYTSSDNVPYISVSQADFYLTEVDNTSLSAYVTKSNSTIVYHGTISIVSVNGGGEVTITFSTPYTYGGGNLLIGSENTTDSGFKRIYFYGQTVNGASIAGSNSSSAASASANQQNFIPKTTFTYTPSAGPVYYSPKNLTVSNIGPNEATATWTPGGDETSWNVEYKKSSDASWTSAGAVSSPSAVLDVLSNGTSYDVRVQGDYGSGNLSGWATTSFMTLMCDPEDMGEISYHLEDSYGDGWNNAAIQILDPNGNVVETLTILHPSSTNTDNLAEGTVSLCYNVEYTFRWVAGNFPTECSFVITGPDGEVIYEVAQGSAPSSSQNLTTYTLLKETSPKPTNLTVNDITANSAKASWTGNDDAQSYNLRYRRAAGFTKVIEESFETFPGSWTIVDSDGDGNNWQQVNPATVFSSALPQYDGSYAVMSRSWDRDALTPDNWLISPQIDLGGVLKYFILDDGTYQETYRIYVSITGTNIADFQPITDDLLSPASVTWTERTADLTAFEGQRGYIAFRQYNCTDKDFMFIDAVSIEKVNDAGEWITVSPATSPQDITGLDPETEYEIQVQAVYADDSSDWTSSVNFTTLSADAVPTNLTVTDVTDCTATANWNGVQDSYNLRYRTPAKTDVLFTESFEGTFPGAWTLVDSDGDGNNWTQFNPMNFSEGGFPAYDGQYGAMSRSWLSSGALTPDNWLISPEIENLGGTLRYYVVDDGSNYPETYQVYVSTAEGTDISNFVAVSEKMQSPNSAEWVEVTIDLSAYAGQSGRIAFRNYDCTDKDFMIIDAVGIYANEVPAGEWVTINDVTSPYVIKGLEPETDYEVQVQGIYDGGTTNWTESEYFTTLEAVSRPMTLAELVANGEVGIRYTISEPLLAVYSVDNKLWLKDDNKFANPASPAEGDQNYEIEEQGNPHANQAEYDQSNWIEVQLPEGVDASIFNGHMINSEAITGVLGDKTNPVMTGVTLTEDDIDDNSTDTGYEYNYYCTANFVGPQNGTIAGETYHFFFMTPKPQECAKVVWAQYDATHNKMVMPDAGNAHGFDGAVDVDLSLNNGTAPVDGTVYNFIAVIRTTESKDGGYKVYPLNISEAVITAVNDITSKTVAGVKYYNLAGIESDRPFEGVNIIVTTYTDGTTSATKVMK